MAVKVLMVLGFVRVLREEEGGKREEVVCSWSLAWLGQALLGKLSKWGLLYVKKYWCLGTCFHPEKTLVFMWYLFIPNSVRRPCSLPQHLIIMKPLLDVCFWAGVCPHPGTSASFQTSLSSPFFCLKLLHFPFFFYSFCRIYLTIFPSLIAFPC